MGLDIVEIALDRISDSKEFEKLASEIMQNEGYPKIKPLGGTHDKGRDAEEERLFESVGKTRTIFQYTLQRDLSGKINETADKLDKAGISYSELVFVTPREIGSRLQDDLKKRARVRHGIAVNIYERKTLVSRLANYENGIFHRHFPDIQKQMDELVRRRSVLAKEDASRLEIALLKAATTLTFGRHAEKARESIFDHLSLAIILHAHPEAIEVEAFPHKFGEVLETLKPSARQISQTLGHLKAEKLVEVANGEVTASKLAIEKSEGITVEVNEATDALVADIADRVGEVYDKPLSQNEKAHVARNARDALVSFFRLFGIELSNQFFKDRTPSPVYLEASEQIIRQTKRDLPASVGTVLVNSIADTLANPAEEHIETLANLSLAFLGIQIMNLDPTLKELQVSRFSKKTFILDTDFVLDCIVQEVPRSKTFVGLVADLRKLGCRILIPEAVVEECLTHANISHNTYKHLNETLFSYDEAFVNQMVGNLFVRGYYYENVLKAPADRDSFDKYLANYCDPRKPSGFFEEVIKTTMPHGVEILNPTSLLPGELPKEQMESMKKELLQLMGQQRKAEYRLAEENEKLAETDARLFLTALHLNAEKGGAQNRIFGGDHYLITSSARYLRCSKRIGIRDEVTTRPQAIASLLEVIGQTSMDSSELIQLFENPFLIHAVKESLDDVKRLVESGLDLRGKSLTRLRWDLDQKFHSKLALIDQPSQIQDTPTDLKKEEYDTVQFMSLLEVAQDSGYPLNPSIKQLLDQLEETRSHAKQKSSELENLKKQFEALEGKFTEFGKRKQRFLRRMAKKVRTR